jgi:hypothetical protein
MVVEQFDCNIPRCLLSVRTRAGILVDQKELRKAIEMVEVADKMTERVKPNEGDAYMSTGAAAENKVLKRHA